MRIAVVGGGIAGLGAARELTAAGHKAVLFEKSKSVGGRAATRRIGAFLFDSGATSVAPRGLALEKVMLNELPQTDLHHIVHPVWTMELGRLAPGDASRSYERYVYKSGISHLPQLLSEGFDIRFETEVDGFAETASGFDVCSEPFDYLILTPPVPHVEAILTAAKFVRYVPTVSYRRSLSAMLGFSRPLTQQPFHALLDKEQSSPVIWISIESQKCPGRAPDGSTAIVCQFGPRYSREHYEDSEAEIAFEASAALKRIFGPEFAKPDLYQIKRWMHSHPEQIVGFDRANPVGSRVLIAGDAVSGPRVEQAYESGVMAARRIIELHPS